MTMRAHLEALRLLLAVHGPNANFWQLKVYTDRVRRAT